MNDEIKVQITDILNKAFESLIPVLLEVFKGVFPIFAIFVAVYIAMLVFKKMSEPDDFDVNDYVDGMYEFATDNNLSPDELEEYFEGAFEDFDEKYEDYIDRDEIDFILDYEDSEEFDDNEFDDEFEEFYQDYYIDKYDDIEFDDEFKEFYEEYYEDL